MMLAYGAASFGALMMGQQVSGSALLDQALQQDMSVGGLMNTAGQVAGLGVSATDAAMIVAGAGLAYKLLQIVERIIVPRLETADLIRRKHALEDWQDPHRGPPVRPPAPTPAPKVAAPVNQPPAKRA